MRLAGLALVSLLAGACTAGPPRVGGPAPALDDKNAERAYRDTLAQATGSAEIYEHFETRAFLAATLQGPAFREARARRMAAFRSETPAELEARLVRERAEDAAGYEWFVGLSVANPAFQDLDRKQSSWRVAMVTTAGEVLPLRIERVGRSSADLRAIYPYLDTFWVGYRVVFPREVEGRPVVPPGSTDVALQIAGVPGRADLVVKAP